jgi:GNAT superfamily N-acetyltransferase
MEIRLCTKADFDQIIDDIADFWGNDRVKNLHNPVYLYEFGNTAYVAKEGDKVIGYLFGLFSQTEPVAYVKFIGVRLSHQKRGIGRRLYEHFTRFARTKGCTELKAITSPANKGSIAFHRAIGMELQGEPDKDGLPVVRDYGGPGVDRVVFTRKI